MRGDPALRRASRGLLCAALIAAFVLLPAAPATAHALLESTSPADGKQLARPPEAVRLEFSEAVSVPTGGLRVYDSAAERIAIGEVGHPRGPTVVQASLPADLSEGTYVVTWRVLSADGHPVKGAFLFSVGAAGASGDSLAAQLFAGDADRPYAIAAAGARWLMYAAALLAAGGAMFLVWVVAADAGDRERFAMIAGVAAAVTAVMVLLGIPLQAAQATGGGLGAFVRADLLAETVASSPGAEAAAQLAGLALLGFALRRPRRPRFAPTAVGGAAVTLGALLLAGHTRTAEPAWLMVSADAVHLAGAAAWFGGLVLLAVALRRRRFDDDPVGAAGFVARFSTVATISVIALSIAGLAMSWVQVRALHALVSTPYGWTLLAKVAAAAGVLAVGAYNNRRLVPAVSRAATRPSVSAGSRSLPVPAGGSGVAAPTARAPRGSAGAWRLLGRTVRWEVTGLVAVLAATALLVSLQPAADAAGITGAYSTYQPLGDYQVNLTVDPNRAGINEIHVYLLDATGRRADIGDDLTLRLSHPEHEIGPIEREPNVAGRGHWILTGRELSLPGRWVIEMDLRVSDFEQHSTEIPVFVGE